MVLLFVEVSRQSDRQGIEREVKCHDRGNEPSQGRRSHG